MRAISMFLVPIALFVVVMYSAEYIGWVGPFVYILILFWMVAQPHCSAPCYMGKEL